MKRQMFGRKMPQRLRVSLGKLNKAFVFACLGGVMLSGCTQSGSSKSSLIVALPDFAHIRSTSVSAKNGNSSMGGDTTMVLQRVMLNVTGGNLGAPIVNIWDAGQQAMGAVAPSSFTVTVPQGGSGLIQVLAILGPSDSNGSSSQMFYYGDTPQSFAADQSVDLTVMPLAAGSVGDQGIVAGRWIDANGNTPTAFVNMQYVPPGKPAMIVSQTEIHGGWFEFTAFQGLNFNFVRADGTAIFSNFNLSNYPSGIPNSQSMVVTVPAAYQANNNNGGALNLRSTGGPWELLLGYFGAGASATGNIICFDNSASDPLTQLYVGTTNAAGNTTATGFIPWAGSGVPTAAQSGVVAGGQPKASGAPCMSTGTAYNNYLTFNQTTLQNSNGSLGFSGPFEFFTPTNQSNSTPFSVQFAGSSLNLTYQFLPGTTGAGRITSVGVFTRILTPATAANVQQGNGGYKVDGGIACNRLTDPSFMSQPFTLVQRYPIQNSGVGAQTISLSGYSSADFLAGNTQVIICPYSDSLGVYFQSGQDFTSYNNGGGNTSIALSSASPSIGAGVCTPLTLNYTINNVPVTAPQTTTLSLSMSTNSSVTGHFYGTDATCSTPSQSSTFVVPQNAIGSTVYFKSGDSTTSGLLNLTTSGLVNLPAPDSGINNSPSFSSLNVAVGTSSTSASTFVNTSLGNITQGSCTPISVAIGVSGGYIQNNQAASVSFGDGGLGGTYYSDPNCLQQASSTLAFAATEFFKTVYFKPGAEASGGALSLTLTNPQGGASPGGATISYSVASAAVTTVYPILQNAITSNGFPSEQLYAQSSCQLINLQPFASNGARTSVAVQQIATVTSADNSMSFSSVGCDDPNASSALQVSMFPGNFNSAVYATFPAAAVNPAPQIVISLLEPAITIATAFAVQPDSITLAVPAVTLANYCQPVELSATLNSAAFTNNSGMAMNFNVSAPGGVTLYASNSCTGGALSETNTVSIASGLPVSATFYVLSPTAQSVSLTATLAGSSVPGTNSSLTTTQAFNVQNLGMTAFIGSSTGSQTPLIANTCYPVTLLFSSPVPMQLNLTGSINSVANLYYSSELMQSGCTNAFTGPVTVSLNSTSTTAFYVKTMSTLSAGSAPQITFTATGGINLSLAGLFLSPPNVLTNPALSCSSSVCN